MIYVLMGYTSVNIKNFGIMIHIISSIFASYHFVKKEQRVPTEKEKFIFSFTITIIILVFTLTYNILPAIYNGNSVNFSAYFIGKLTGNVFLYFIVIVVTFHFMTKGLIKYYKKD
jgi:hypothetical protein